MFRLSELHFEISMLSLHTVIGLSLDIISKCLNILSKPTEPKVSSAIAIFLGKIIKSNVANISKSTNEYYKKIFKKVATKWTFILL